MRRALLSLVLCGCFNEPDTVDKTASTTAASTTIEPEESSSSEGESSSGEGTEESSSTTEDYLHMVCPEWCNNGCDMVAIYQLCRCTNGFECQDGLVCERPGEEVGHCR